MRKSRIISCQTWGGGFSSFFFLVSASYFPFLGNLKAVIKHKLIVWRNEFYAIFTKLLLDYSRKNCRSGWCRKWCRKWHGIGRIRWWFRVRSFLSRRRCWVRYYDILRIIIGSLVTIKNFHFLSAMAVQISVEIFVYFSVLLILQTSFLPKNAMRF